MKSKLFPIILGLSVFLMISCNNDATDSQSSLPSNLPESKGTNEFTGKTPSDIQKGVHSNDK